MTNRGITVLSLFDGMSCGQIALREAGIKVDKYFASEIDKHAIAQTQHNFPDTIQLGSVTDVHAADLPHIDLLIGGSPCQGVSFAGKQLNFNDPRSVLFFEYVRILREIQEYNPRVLFLLENVRMRRDCELVITEHLGLEPVVINSALVSAQNRVRLYWTNIRTREEANLLYTKVFTDIPQPKDRGILLGDILEDAIEPRHILSEKRIAKLFEHSERQKENSTGFGSHPRRESEKSNTLRVGGSSHDDIVMLEGSRAARCVAIRGRYNEETKRNEQTAEFRPDDKTNCLTSGEKDNLIFIEAACLTPKRTEYGKAIRRQYEAGEVQESRHNMTELEPRTDGKTNTLTTVQKDNLILQFPRGYNNGRLFAEKSPTLTSNSWEQNNIYFSPQAPIYRRLTVKECSRLQTIPDWYEWKCSNSQAYKMLGNGWTVEVIKHIFQFINT